MGVIINGSLNIGGTNNINITKEPIIVSYSFSVSTENNTCDFPIGAITIYSSSPSLGIGSTLFTDINLTIPTTYSLISNPNAPNNRYFTITGNTISDNIFCG